MSLLKALYTSPNSSALGNEGENMHLCRMTSEALLRSADLTLVQSIIHKKPHEMQITWVGEEIFTF